MDIQSGLSSGYGSNLNPSGRKGTTFLMRSDSSVKVPTQRASLSKGQKLLPITAPIYQIFLKS